MLSKYENYEVQRSSYEKKNQNTKQNFDTTPIYSSSSICSSAGGFWFSLVMTTSQQTGTWVDSGSE